METAARTNYEYSQNPQANIRNDCVMAMARRYLESKIDREKALAKMKSTIVFRQTMGIDDLKNASNNPNNSDHLPLHKFISRKALYVSCYDKEGRSTFIFVPRLCGDHHHELKALLWTLERAIACSKAKDHTVNAVVDFAGFYSILHTPPLGLSREVMSILRDHYVGQIHKIFLVNVPSAFYILWSILKPLAGKKTRDKINFVNSDCEKEEVIGEWYSVEQAPGWMLPNGCKKQSLDVQKYIEAPFDQAFDE